MRCNDRQSRKDSFRKIIPHTLKLENKILIYKSADAKAFAMKGSTNG